MANVAKDYKHRIWYDDDNTPRLCGTFTKKDGCGTRTGFVMGCRGEKCYQSNRDYYNGKYKKKYSYIPVDSAREHLKWLVSKGAIQRRIAEHTGIRKRDIWQIIHSRKYIAVWQHEKILALHLGMENLFQWKKDSAYFNRGSSKNVNCKN
jgi:hypothetical protein